MASDDANYRKRDRTQDQRIASAGMSMRFKCARCQTPGCQSAGRKRWKGGLWICAKCAQEVDTKSRTAV